MKSRRIWYAYLALGVTLITGCLYAERNLPAGRHSHAGIAADASVEGAGTTWLRHASFALADPAPTDTTDRGSMPAEKVYRNIQTLRGMSASEVSATMTFISASLGVHCGFCHAQGDFASDDKPAKKTARSMILMTEDINAKNFGTTTVTCYSCHRGNPVPVAVPSLAQGDWGRLDVSMELKKDSTTTAEAVLDRYTRELGGEAAMGKIRTRTIKASESQAGGTTATVEVFQKLPNKFRSVTTSSDARRGTGIMWYDGTTAGMVFGNRPPNVPNNAELEQLLREAEFFPASDIRKSYTGIRLLGREHIGDRNVLVIEAKRNKSSERLYFDAATGLLVRRYVEFHMTLGSIPFSVEYSDYRTVDGVKVPYTAKWSTLRDSWTDTITELHNNAPVDDALFTRQ
ncbi:MAG: c-type cytochrome [Bacteroidetes bacterium]|nr:c-type cytochrome [Bacteroidota bacterium]